MLPASNVTWLMEGWHPILFAVLWPSSMRREGDSCNCRPAVRLYELRLTLSSTRVRASVNM